MLTYKDFAPTAFDQPGAFLLSRHDWLVAPVSQTRDSDALARSNFETALGMLGGESKGVEVHRFGHWGPGWFEIILVNPRSRYAAIAAEIEDKLEYYPVLDETDLSERQNEEARESWRSWGAWEWRQHHCKMHSLGQAADSALESLSDDVLYQWIGDHLNWAQYWLLGQDRMPECDRKDMAELLRHCREQSGRGKAGPRPTFLGFPAPNQLALNFGGVA